MWLNMTYLVIACMTYVMGSFFPGRKLGLKHIMAELLNFPVERGEEWETAFQFWIRNVCVIWHKTYRLSIFSYLFQDELHGIEPLTEDAIVTGSYKHKSLCANPEDTCDFVRAAHLASTPFHGVVAQRIPAPAYSQSVLKEDCAESKSAPLDEKTPVCEGTYSEALCVNKLR